MGKQVNLLDNLDHVNILDRWIRTVGYVKNDSDLMYLADRVQKYFPEYREQDLLELADLIGLIFDAPL